MADLLIRNFPDEDLAILDERAAKLGLSRVEYLRRQLQQQARRSATAVRAEDLRGFAEVFADLGDPSVMNDAWS